MLSKFGVTHIVYKVLKYSRYYLNGHLFHPVTCFYGQLLPLTPLRFYYFLTLPNAATVNHNIHVLYTTFNLLCFSPDFFSS